MELANSPRRQQARLAAQLNTGGVRTGLAALAFLFVFAALGLLYIESSWAWFALGLAALVFACSVWIKQGLANIAPNTKGQAIVDLLDSSVLGKLPDKPAPSDFANALRGTAGGNFFGARYGIGTDIIAQISSTNSEDTAKLWQRALQIQQDLKPGEVTSATLAAALIVDSPMVNDFLPHLSLDESEIIAGVEWYQHIRDVIEMYRQPKKTGGIARDWAFGFTPLLERFGVNISHQAGGNSLPHQELESHQQVLGQLTQLFTNSTRANAALVGQLGVGKMAIVHAFARSLLLSPSVPKTLRYNQVISLDAASLISAAPGRGQLEQLVNDVLIEAYHAKNIILCLDNAQLFFEDGTGSVNLSNVLLPVLEGGGLRIILTMDTQRWLQISQRTPALATSINRISIEPPSKEETLRILQNQLIAIEYQTKATYMYQALEIAYDLGDRYVTEQAMPGKAVKVLEQAAQFAENGFVTADSVRKAIEQTTGVRVGNATQVEERQTLLDMEALLHERMIGQERAVRVVSDALRRARSGVRNQNRPIGTFLFLGPTGVGKTELSKALAAVYFGGEDRLLRVDLNEYVRSEDVARLIADASTNEHSLAAQVTRQPFSVVLLDEIEKAHPDVLTTLLQVLDEGMLRDINGREVNCRDAIIIATSNAGAQMIREHIANNTPLEDVEKQLTNDLITSGEFRPEFLNRFDEIVVFAPLTKPQLRKIIDLILQGLNKNMAQQKITVAVNDDAKDLLVEAGYDPQLGARPMRRVVQRCVENVVARNMLSGGAAPGQTITITLQDIQANLDQR